MKATLRTSPGHLSKMAASHNELLALLVREKGVEWILKSLQPPAYAEEEKEESPPLYEDESGCFARFASSPNACVFLQQLHPTRVYSAGEMHYLLCSVYGNHRHTRGTLKYLLNAEAQHGCGAILHYCSKQDGYYLNPRWTKVHQHLFPGAENKS